MLKKETFPFSYLFDKLEFLGVRKYLFFGMAQEEQATVRSLIFIKYYLHDSTDFPTQKV